MKFKVGERVFLKDDLDYYEDYLTGTIIDVMEDIILVRWDNSFMQTLWHKNDQFDYCKDYYREQRLKKLLENDRKEKM